MPVQVVRQPTTFKQIVVALSILDFEIDGVKYEVTLLNESELVEKIDRFLLQSPHSDESKLALYRALEFMASDDGTLTPEHPHYVAIRQVMCEIDSEFYSNMSPEAFEVALVANVQIVGVF